MSYEIGNIYNSKNFGNFEIIGQVQPVFEKLDTNKKDLYFKIRFLNTGYEYTVSRSALIDDRIKDKFIPSIAGVGYIGKNIKITDPEYCIFYRSWNDIINRCYNESDKDYKYYGALGIRVDQRWFNFYNFYQDIQIIPGYDLKIKYPSIYQLDKDYLQLNIPKSKRIYSRETCIWLSKFDNILVMNRDKENKSGYYGVIYKDGGFCTRINNFIYGKFNCPEAAANLFNYLYPIIQQQNPFNNISILNDVPLIPYNELPKYYVDSKYNKVGSTTIPEMGVGSK